MSEIALALFVPSQAAGAAGGALAIIELMPVQYKHTLMGPFLKVDLHTVAIAEGVLTFVITFLVLCNILRGPKNALLKNWLLAMTTVVIGFARASYAGPSMNPAIAFGWAYADNRHNTWEQFYVYWVSPFVGGHIISFAIRCYIPRKPEEEATSFHI
ncbi:Aquaporin SIP [Heracleum sosnowskyi]|uniref:Aquaporin SIP n=1 Tax=Heracleum sosnowskyi TaxID=360622 RepID=A0AAD8HHI9_9APIA|nr:Aquaporin SIP [Heracleum sosnowskyi]